EQLQIHPDVAHIDFAWALGETPAQHESDILDDLIMDPRFSSHRAHQAAEIFMARVADFLRRHVILYRQKVRPRCCLHEYILISTKPAANGIFTPHFRPTTTGRWRDVEGLTVPACWGVSVKNRPPMTVLECRCGTC